MLESLGVSKRLSYLKRISFKKTGVYAAIPVLYLYLPVYIAAHFCAHPVLCTVAFYLANSALVFSLVQRSISSTSKLRYEVEDIEGRMNVLTAHNSEILSQNISLKENISRYASMKKVIEQITQELNPESVCESLCASAFSLIASERGTCILYLADSEVQSLKLTKAKKEDKKLILKAKQGDILDHWVMMHMNPLLIEDIGKDFRFDLDRVKSLDGRTVGSVISSPLVSGGTFLGILRLDHPDPGYYNLDDLRFLRSICDLGALALESAQLYSSTQELAVHDGLTGVYTKAHFLELLAVECHRSMRGKKQFGLLMIDIDHFKTYNDTYGHSAGDIVLATIAGRISELLKSRGGVVCRFGGEEFCVLLSGVEREQAREAAELLREAVARETFILRRKETSVTISIGVATFPEDSDDEIGLLMKADKAMYAAKQKGRNRVVVS